MKKKKYATWQVNLSNMSLFYWSEETINYFKFISSYLSKKQTIRKIELFVEMDCIPAEEETEDMLVQDLINVIYK